MKHIILITMSIFNTFFGISTQQLEQVTILEPKAYKEAIRSKDIRLIDVRTN